MYFAQHYLDCLSQASYLIGDETTGRAVVIDPRRDVSSTERQSTIGMQRLTNYACAPMSEGEFMALVTEGQPPAPGYFTFDAVLNRRQHGVLDVAAHARPLSAAEALSRRAAGAVVIDVRDPHEFAAAHLHGSLNVPADGRFAERAGMVVEPGTEIIVVAPPGGEDETITRLGRIGFDTIAGYLDEPEAAFLTFSSEVDQANRLTASELREALGRPRPPVVLDVRNTAERTGGAIDGSVHIPLAELPRRLAEVPDGRPVVVYCAHGTRSSIAASLLRRSGHSDVSDLIGGETAWRLALTAA